MGVDETLADRHKPPTYLTLNYLVTHLGQTTPYIYIHSYVSAKGADIIVHRRFIFGSIPDKV
jgi:hypothetical protein